MSELSDLEQFVYEFTHSVEQLNASLEYLLEKGNQEHEELMRQISEIRSDGHA